MDDDLSAPMPTTSVGRYGTQHTAASSSAASNVCQLCAKKDADLLKLKGEKKQLKTLCREQLAINEELQRKASTSSGSSSGSGAGNIRELETRITELEQERLKVDEAMVRAGNNHRSEVKKLNLEKNNLEGELKTAQTRITKLQKDLESAKAASKAAASSAAASSVGGGYSSFLGLGSGSSSAAAAQQALAKKQELDQLNEQVSALKEAFESVNQQLQEKGLENTEILQTVSRLTIETNQARERAEKAEERVRDLTKTLALTEESQRQIQSQNQALESMLQETKSLLSQSLTRQTDLQSELTQLQQQHSTLMRENQRHMEELEAQSDQIQHSTSELSQAQKQWKVSQRELEDLREELQTRSDELDESRQTIESLQSKLDQSLSQQVDTATMQQQLDQMQQQLLASPGKEPGAASTTGTTIDPTSSSGLTKEFDSISSKESNNPSHDDSDIDTFLSPLPDPKVAQSWLEQAEVFLRLSQQRNQIEKGHRPPATVAPSYQILHVEPVAIGGVSVGAPASTTQASSSSVSSLSAEFAPFSPTGLIGSLDESLSAAAVPESSFPQPVLATPIRSNAESLSSLDNELNDSNLNDSAQAHSVGGLFSPPYLPHVSPQLPQSSPDAPVRHMAQMEDDSITHSAPTAVAAVPILSSSTPIPTISSWFLHQHSSRWTEAEYMLHHVWAQCSHLLAQSSVQSLQLQRAQQIAVRRQQLARSARLTAEATLQKLAEVQLERSKAEVASKELVDELSEKMARLNEQLAEKDAKGW